MVHGEVAGLKNGEPVVAGVLEGDHRHPTGALPLDSTGGPLGYSPQNENFWHHPLSVTTYTLRPDKKWTPEQIAIQYYVISAWFPLKFARQRF